MADARDRHDASSSSWLNWLVTFAAIAAAIATCAGAFIGFFAYLAYIQTNSITLQNRLEDTYTSLSRLYADPNTEYFSSIYDEVDWEGVSTVEEAQQLAADQVKMLLEPTVRDQVSSDLFKGGVAGFSCGLWVQPNNGNERLVRELRSAFFHAEEYLFVMHIAWEAKENETFDREDLAYWTAFIGEIGINPMFLAVVHDAHRWGYIKPGFSEWLWGAYRDPSSTGREISPDERPAAEFAKTLTMLYPDLVGTQDEWMGNYNQPDGACPDELMTSGAAETPEQGSEAEAISAQIRTSLFCWPQTVILAPC